MLGNRHSCLFGVDNPSARTETHYSGLSWDYRDNSSRHTVYCRFYSKGLSCSDLSMLFLILLTVLTISTGTYIVNCAI